jgi:Zn-dependent protease with chaperone function
MFELLGISLFLAGLLWVNLVGSLISTSLWLIVSRHGIDWSAPARVRLLFALRTWPCLLAFFLVVLLLVPAYLAHEPRNTTEVVGVKLGLLASVSALGILVAGIRLFASWSETRKLTRNWLANAEPLKIPGIDTPSYRINHPFPLIAVIGVLRPRLFVAERILNLLSADEIAAAMKHEQGHLLARDNLKRTVMRACRDMLFNLPDGGLDCAWARAAEEAADEMAAKKDSRIALDLASALVKIARTVPLGARPTMAVGGFLFGLNEAEPIGSRVKRLLEFANGPQQQLRPKSINPAMLWSATGVLCFLTLLLHSESILLNVHFLIEQAVHFLD